MTIVSFIEILKENVTSPSLESVSNLQETNESEGGEGNTCTINNSCLLQIYFRKNSKYFFVRWKTGK